MLTSIVTVVTWQIAWMNPADSHSWKTLVMQYLMIKVILHMGKKVLARLNSEAKNLAQCQEVLLTYILRDNAETDYGQKYDFSNIKSVGEYQQRVPLTHHDDYRQV